MKKPTENKSGGAKRRPTFNQWLVKTYKDQDTPMGDFARDFEYDNPPRFSSREQLLNYLHSRGAIEVVLELAEAAWDEYEG